VSRAGGTVTCECPSPKPRDLSTGTLSITLPLISPKSLLASSWAVRLHVLVLRSWTLDAAVEDIAQTPSLGPLYPPSHNCTSGSLPKMVGGLRWVTFDYMVNLPWAKRATVTAVSHSSLAEATYLRHQNKEPETGDFSGLPSTEFHIVCPTHRPLCLA